MSTKNEESRLERVADRYGGRDTLLFDVLSHRLGLVGSVIVLFYVLVALLGPILYPGDPLAMDATRMEAPTAGYPFGTDNYGRDVLGQTIAGARLSLYVAAAVVGFSTVLGVTFGLVSAYYARWVDETIMRIVDVMLAFPGILLALVIIAILGPGLNRAVLALGIAFTPVMTRIVRGNALAIREEEYILAAKGYGERDLYIMFKEMFPNLTSVVIVQATIAFAFSILAEASLSYLGLSAQPPTITWGVMISEGQSLIEVAPWVSFFPGLAIMITVLGLTFLGVALRDALDPNEVEMGKGL